tara:strand:+ start:5116 stop:7182 length:2067 start_codon:yes stop_codon:yes gene_type:complete
MAVALSETGPFSYDKYTLTSTQAENEPAKRTFTLTKAVFNPALPETIEVLIDGVKLKGDGTATAAGSGDEFYVNSATSPTTMTIETNTVLNATTDSTVTSLGTGNLLLIRRISNRTTKNVDYAPGSVIREVDLDNSNTQVIHMAQEAIDIAKGGIILDADDKFDSNSKVIKSVANGIDDNDAVNKAQLTATEVTTEAYKEDTEDYKRETADWATKVNGVVNTYTDDSANSDGSEYSAKAYSVGGTGVTGGTSRGAAKDWAIGAGGVMATKPDGSEYSAKEYAQGVTAAGGTAKQWALGGGSHVEATEVITGEYSAKKYASNASGFADAASASEIAARNSANAVTNIFDDFGDKYLGTMSSSDTATTGAITGATWVKGGSQITNVTVASGTVEKGQVLIDPDAGGTAAVGWPSTTTVRIIDYNSGTSTITINQVFTAADSGENLTATGYGVYGAYDTNKEGPAKDNDNGNLVDGALYFDTTNSVNSMRVYDLGNTKWVKATSSGTVSISEFKFTATANQTTFTGSATSGGTLAYSTSNLIVTLNGVVLENGTDYTASNGTSIVLGSGASVGHELNVIAFKSFETADMVSATNGGTFNSNVSFGDNNITNVGDIALDTISSDAGTSIGVTLGTDAGDDFNVGSGKLLVEGDTGLVSIGTGGDFQTSTTGKIKQKGAFMQSSTHQSLVLGG